MMTITPKKIISSSRTAQERSQLCDEFFDNQVEARQLLEPFKHLPGILYFVKDVESRLMAISWEAVERMGFESDVRFLHEANGTNRCSRCPRICP